MKINKEKLVELLVEKTEMEKAEIESQLNELIKRITSAAERGKALEIKGFGLFYFDENGDLKFDPADELKTEVNFKYAGMEPVELKPPRDTSKEDSGEPVSDDDIFGIEDELIAEEESKGEINFDEFNHDKSDDSDDEDDNPFASLLEDAASSIEDKDEKEVKKTGTAPNVSSTKKSAQKEPKKNASSAKKKPKSTGQKDPVMMVVFILLGVVVLAGGYFIINDYLNAPEQSANANMQVQTEEPPAVAEQDLTEVEPEAEDTVEDPEPVEESAEDETPDIPTYGLYGDIIDAGNNGYTIVLHSLRSESHANEIAGELKDDGYRSMVNGRTVDGRAVFRVSVGQFPSISDAQAEAAELPAPYNEQNFIQRIRN
ncbi:MAG: SPOR domain-containing protein [Balneolaceae bacterium]